MNELQTTGKYEITCLCYKSSEQDETEQLDGIKIHRFIRSHWWNKVVDANRGLSNHKKVILFCNTILLRLKQLITIPIYPYVNIKSCIKFAWKAWKLSQKEDFDIVISEHNGLDSLFAGYILKLIKPSIKFVAILWDPISAKEVPAYLPFSYGHRRLLKQEKRLLSTADLVIGMKSSEATIIQNGFKFEGNHVLGDIPGIIRPSRHKTQSKYLDKERINVVFSGILSLPDRNPEYIIDLLNDSAIADELNLLFFCTGAGREILEEKRNTFKGRINILNYIPHNELMDVYDQSDILLNFGGRNPNMVPSKIFEYMSFGKPIISVYSINDEASKEYLKYYPLAICIDERLSIQDNLRGVNAFLRSSKGKSIEYEIIEKTFPLNTPGSYVRLIDTL